METKQNNNKTHYIKNINKMVKPYTCFPNEGPVKKYLKKPTVKANVMHM